MLTLTKNMRASDSEYAEFLEEVGVGKFEGKISPFIRLERSEIMCNSEEEVLAATYDKRKVRFYSRTILRRMVQILDQDYMYKTCVLATRNVETMRINDKVISTVSRNHQ